MTGAHWPICPGPLLKVPRRQHPKVLLPNGRGTLGGRAPPDPAPHWLWRSRRQHPPPPPRLLFLLPAGRGALGTALSACALHPDKRPQCLGQGCCHHCSGACFSGLGPGGRWVLCLLRVPLGLSTAAFLPCPDTVERVFCFLTAASRREFLFERQCDPLRKTQTHGRKRWSICWLTSQVPATPWLPGRPSQGRQSSVQGSLMVGRRGCFSRALEIQRNLLSVSHGHSDLRCEQSTQQPNHCFLPPPLRASTPFRMRPLPPTSSKPHYPSKPYCL